MHPSIYKICAKPRFPCVTSITSRHTHTSCAPKPASKFIYKADLRSMEASNVQWWAKPNPMAAAGAPAQIGSYRIPGLGSNTPSGTFTPPAGSPSAFQQRNKSPKGIKRKLTGDPRAQMSDRDKILAPSPASGGVPEPTEAYLTRAFTPSATLPTPKPILVVMDLNGTLLHRPSRRHATSFVERPHAKRFLQYCLDTFHVVIWSSARPANVQSMCDQLLLGPSGDDSRASYRSRVLATWGRDRFGLSTADYNLRVQVYKRLDMVWDDPRVKASHPDGGVWDQSNTVLVDDSLEKARSEPYNLLPIPEFFGNASEPGLVVPQVHDYLNSLCYQSDVSSYMRENPFQVKENYKLAPPVEQ